MARSSWAFVIFERPSILSRVACAYSCSFVRPLERLEELERLVEPERERDLLDDPDWDLPDELDPERLELAVEREDVELFRARDDEPVRDLLAEPERDPLVEPERDRLLGPDRVDRERVDEPLERPP
jgi:hypothetical protein